MRVLVAGFDELPVRTAYDVWRLRQQVFVVEQDCPYPDLDGRDLEDSTRHLVLLDDEDAVVGTLRVLDDGGWSRIGRVVVAPAARGRGLAAVMMDEAMALCGDREVRLDAQTGLTAFYEGYGFVATGPEFDEDGVMHVPMARAERPSTL
ncbi:GNAT family N-acetyltransferase [Nocardioides cavernae]|uniref:GNAT family N-acetyltransferase n=1 Tax=Nocardioides cavernae TaxID=1921566 RepID=A0ABR8N8T8_9ACTN|nr:GNAT family N-acetyltransferase [Nocardioides cavernae]MBD3924558.1 GNAT family N-acetyltransferase [Nocardioides cavernae]MBM7510493.1 ElaA protein [Nocardioides cavernae]